MKNPRTLNTDYDAWLKRFQYETLKNLYKRWDAVMAGAEIGNIDLIEDKISILCEKMGITVEDAVTKITLDESNGIN
tara:strand:+ start:281 stop:511 length:231 start_codon:yes stop_codon:yes gene_type:complete